MAAPLVSIGLPVGNREALAGIGIESVLDQSLGDFELIICDNDLSARTPEIGEGYARRDRRIRDRHQRQFARRRAGRHLPEARDRWRCYARLARCSFLSERLEVMSFDRVDFASASLAHRGRILKRRLFGPRQPFEEIRSGVATAPE